MTIKYVIGDATRPSPMSPHQIMIIAHVCNDIGRWGAGFSGALSRRFKMAEESYRISINEHKIGLGDVDYVSVSQYIIVANMIAQHGIGTNKRRIRYGALAKCLASVSRAAHSRNCSVHMPRIGCGLAGGKWEFIEAIIEDEMPDVDVFVYDLEKK